MKYLFSAIYVLGAIIIVLNLIQLFTMGWSWAPVVKIFLAFLWLLGNYWFMKEAYKAKREPDNKKTKK